MQDTNTQRLYCLAGKLVKLKLTVLLAESEIIFCFVFCTLELF